MEVRCGKCNKLFRVSDDKITGSGIKFSCSRCGDAVRITPEDFEQYKLSEATAAVLTSPEPKPKSAGATPEGVRKAAAAPPASGVDFGAVFPNGPAAEEAPPKFVKSPSQAEPGREAKTFAPPKPEPRPAVVSRPVPVGPALSPIESEQPAEAMSAAPKAASGGKGKKILAFVAVLLIIMAAAVFGARWYLGQLAQKASEIVKAVTTPEGLQINNAAGAIDPVSNDLVITGVVENTTDKPRPAWYIVAEVYDAQNVVLVKAKLVSGKQIYTRRDYEILTRRGANVQDIKKKNLEQGATIPPRGSVNFEIRVMEPPAAVASFNATLQPFDPVQLFKEIVEDQKQQ